MIADGFSEAVGLAMTMVSDGIMTCEVDKAHSRCRGVLVCKLPRDGSYKCAEPILIAEFRRFWLIILCRLLVMLM